jgi:2'-5' RNA ligase
VADAALVVPVPTADPVIGQLRREHTRSGADGMPSHLTLLYPFTTGRETEIEQALAPFTAFEYTLPAAAVFGEPPVLYLEPDPADRFLALIEALMAAFPEFPPYGGVQFYPEPHVTIAQGDESAFAAIRAEVEPLLPISGRADEVLLFEHDADHGWRPRTRFPLG